MHYSTKFSKNQGQRDYFRTCISKYASEVLNDSSPDSNKKEVRFDWSFEPLMFVLHWHLVYFTIFR